ncbi:MAG: hypothetical protein QXO76_11635 [Thermoproteota archaeon]
MRRMKEIGLQAWIAQQSRMRLRILPLEVSAIWLVILSVLKKALNSKIAVKTQLMSVRFISLSQMIPTTLY